MCVCAPQGTSQKTSPSSLYDHCTYSFFLHFTRMRYINSRIGSQFAFQVCLLPIIITTVVFRAIRLAFPFASFRLRLTFDSFLCWNQSENQIAILWVICAGCVSVRCVVGHLHVVANGWIQRVPAIKSHKPQRKPQLFRLVCCARRQRIYKWIPSDE